MRILKPDPIKLGIPDPRIGVCISMAPIVGNYFYIFRTNGERAVLIDFLPAAELKNDDQILNSGVDLLEGVQPSESGLREADYAEIVKKYNLCLL